MTTDANEHGTDKKITAKAGSEQKSENSSSAEINLCQHVRNYLSTNPAANYILKLLTYTLTLIGFVSTCVTLGGTSLPAIRDKFFPQFSDAVRSIPVVSGRYTFCSDDTKRNQDADSKLFNFLYDVRQSEKKIAFFDVVVDTDCSVSEREEGEHVAPQFSRELEQRAVTYAFHFPEVKVNDRKSVAKILSGERDIAKFIDIYADNGSYLRFDAINGSNNVFSKMALNIEGVEDHIYGPYQVKIVAGEASAYYELTAPILDSSTATAVTYIDEQRLKIHEKESHRRETPNLPITFNVFEWQHDVDAGIQWPVPKFIEKRAQQMPSIPLPPLQAPSQGQSELEINRLYKPDAQK